MQCPGQDSRYWGANAIFEAECPSCGNIVEFFKDEGSRPCKKCGHRVLNPKIDFGCATYCPYAEQCMGGLPEELKTSKKEMLKDQVAVAMKKYFGVDFKRIAHAGRVARYAEAINAEEKGNPAVVTIAAFLHDIGIKEAERKYNSTSPRYQHQEGPPIARQILTDLQADAELIDEVCDIIGHHHQPRPEETTDFKVLYDADLLVNLEEGQKEEPLEPEKLAGLIGKTFLTETGRALAQKVLLEQTGTE
ncbi:MAG: HD domain-containing protein [Deltaproteobacteria bacterium]